MSNLKGTSKVIGELAKRIVYILRDCGVVEVSVFGSFLQGDVHFDSGVKKKIERNDPCLYASGKQFKTCCLDK